MAIGKRVRPMIHVPDVRATTEWYQSVGFEIVSINEDDGKVDWALLSFGDGQVMFNAGGSVSSATRREVDLYVDTDDVDGLYERLKDLVEVHKGIHETFYGMREFIVRDIYGFWVTFGESGRAGRARPWLPSRPTRHCIRDGGWARRSLSYAPLNAGCRYTAMRRQSTCG